MRISDWSSDVCSSDLPHRGGLRPLVRGRLAGEVGLMPPEGIQSAVDAAGATASFDPLRPLLTRVAYRMLGSVADAEDVVQEAFIRWLGTDRDAVREPAAFLRRTVTRLCLDQIKSARSQRETYIGPWLPDRKSTRLNSSH